MIAVSKTVRPTLWAQLSQDYRPLLTEFPLMCR